MAGRSPDAGRLLLLVLAATAVVFGGWALSSARLERHRGRYVVSVDDGGRALTQVVTAAFARATELKVGGDRTSFFPVIRRGPAGGRSQAAIMLI